MKKKIFYYWANNTKKNEGEGILANNFLTLLQQKYNSYVFLNINKYKYKNSFFYNYILPIYGAIKVNNLSNKQKTVYINYLPLWNFLLFLILSKKVILGPITGTIVKKNFFYFLFCKISLLIIKFKKKKILLSNNYFKNDFHFIKKKKLFHDFLFYNFKFNKKVFRKKYDIVFYFRKNKNKGNRFFISLINLLLKENYKIAVIGDKFVIKDSNLDNFINLSRSKARKIISQSKSGINTKENLYSFFCLDCLSFNNIVFYNGDLPKSNNLKTNLLVKYNIKNLDRSFNTIKKKLSNKIHPQISIKNLFFNDYL